jgi:hypothetical protein
VENLILVRENEYKKLMVNTPGAKANYARLISTSLVFDAIIDKS